MANIFSNTIDDESYSLLVKQQRDARAGLYACLLATGLIMVALVVTIIIAMPIGHYILVDTKDNHSSINDFIVGIVILVMVTFVIFVTYGIFYIFYHAFIITLPSKNDKNYKTHLDSQQRARGVCAAVGAIAGFGFFSYCCTLTFLSIFTSDTTICTNDKLACIYVSSIVMFLTVITILVLVALIKLVIITIYNAFSSLPKPNKHIN